MSLILWYPFIKDGYNRGTAEGQHLSPVFEDNGMLGKCIFLNKKTLSTTINLATSYNSVNTDLTISTWVKLNLEECKAYIKTLSYSSTAHTACGCVAGSTSYGGTGIVWTSNQIYNSSGTNNELSSIKMFGYVRGTGGQFTTSSKVIPFGKWTHVAMTSNHTTKRMKFFVNGELINDVSFSALTEITGTRNFGLNLLQVYGGNGPGGSIPIRYNDVRLYDEELSLMEIRELSKGLVFHYTFNDVYAEKTTNIDSCKNAMTSKTLSGASNLGTGSSTVGKYTFGNFYGFDCFKVTMNISNISAWTGVYLNINPTSYGAKVGDTVVRSCWMYVPIGKAKPEHFTESIEGSASNKEYKQYDFNKVDTWQRVWMKGTITSTTGTNNFLHYFMAMSSGNVDFEFYIRDFQMEINDHASAYTSSSRDECYYDESGNGYDANQIDMKYTENTNIGCLAASFNGSTSCLEVPFIRSDLFKTPYTLSFWVKPTDNDRAVYFGDHQLSGGVSMNFERMNGGNFRYYHGGSPDKIFALTTPVNEWTMVTVTSDTTTLRFYKNGVEVPNTAYTFTPTITKSSGVMRIGRDNRSDYTALGGYMNDFRWYGTALSANDIYNLYTSKAAIDKKNNLYTNQIIEQDENNNMVNIGSWEQSGIQDTNGANSDGMLNRLRTKYIPVFPNTQYYFGVKDTSMTVRGVHFYDKDNKWISYQTSPGVKTTPSNCYYVRWVIQKTDGSTVVSVGGLKTYKPVMIYKNHGTEEGIAPSIDVQVNKKYNINVKEICENHDSGFFKDGAVSCNNFHEI